MLILIIIYFAKKHLDRKRVDVKQFHLAIITVILVHGNHKILSWKSTVTKFKYILFCVKIEALTTLPYVTKTNDKNNTLDSFIYILFRYRPKTGGNIDHSNKLICLS